ncbi:MAG: hypothetical protein ACOZF2_04855 [Thermodesulfobacteriota bacterium]
MKFKTVDFPFKSRLSLKPLLDFWERLSAEGKCGMSALGPVVQQKLKNAPELLEPIEDLTILEKHQEYIQLLMSAVFPPAFWESDYAAAFVPFQFTSFYATPAFKIMFKMEGQGLPRN